MIQIDQKHNYSKESREAVYTFFNARLLGGKGPVKEQRYRVEQLQDLLVLFGKDRPADAVTMERYVSDRIADARQSVDHLAPRDRDSLDKGTRRFSRAADVLPARCETGDGPGDFRRKRHATASRDSAPGPCW